MSKILTRLLDAAHAIHTDAPDELAFIHTILAQCCLPHRAPPLDARSWTRQQGRAILHVQAGESWHPRTGSFVPIGLPYGAGARLILMHFNTEAVRNQSPVIEVESSLTAFVRRVKGYPPNGTEMRSFKEQLARLSAATVRLALTDGEEHTLQRNINIVGAFDLWFPKNDQQRVLWPTTVQLSLDYFDSLSRHAVPLDERAIAALANSAMALDLYCWLAQRLHRVPEKGQAIPWPALYDQFGQGYAQLRQFRAFFLKQLRNVQAVYQDAKFETNASGMILRQSPPPVPKRLAQVTGDW